MNNTSEVRSSVLEHLVVMPKQKHRRQSPGETARSLNVPSAALHCYNKTEIKSLYYTNVIIAKRKVTNFYIPT